MNRDVSPRLVSPARPFSHSLVQAVFRRALESVGSASGGNEEVWVPELLEIRKSARYPGALSAVIRKRVEEYERLIDKGDWSLDTMQGA